MPARRYSHFHFGGTFVAGYDAFNHIASMGMDIIWRRNSAAKVQRRMAQQQLISPTILDLACGTGDMALSLYRRLRQGIIIGSDPSAEMLQLGRRKNSRYHADVHYLRAVGRLPFANRKFDAVTCAFGMRNFVDLEDDLCEVYRLLKPQGAIFVLDFFVPQNLFSEYLLRLYSILVFPLLGLLLTGHTQPYRYLFGSIFKFLTVGDFSLLLNKVGFSDVSTRRYFFGLANMVVGLKH